jgi:hypothetical protein
VRAVEICSCGELLQAGKVGHPAAMTENTSRLAEILCVYADHPLDSGDAVLVLDDRVCLEIEGLADHWDAVLRHNTAQVVRSTSERVLVLIARPQALLQDSDYQLWRDLHADLRDSVVQLLPVRALPAA